MSATIEWPELPPAAAYESDVRVMNGRHHPIPNRVQAVQPFAVQALDALTVAADSDIIQGIYGTQSVVAVVGVPNCGKTAFGIDQALHVAAGATWFSQKVRGGCVLYVAPEAPASVSMRAKVAAARKFPGQRLPFYLVSAVPELGGQNTSVIDAQRILATIAHVQSEEGEAVKLVAIDTLASCLGDGDENGSGMLLLVAAAKSIATSAGCAVMLIHHPSKGGDGASPRGHGSLLAACDAVITITSDEHTGIRTATLTKSRDSATGLQFAYQLEAVALDERDSFGDVRTTVIVRPVQAHEAPRKRPGGKAQEAMLIELERRYRTGETGWDRATILRAGRGIGQHRNTASTALKGLLVAGFLKGSDARHTLTDPPEDCT